MEQALQVMFYTIIISVIVGFLISLMIMGLDKIVNLNHTEEKRSSETEAEERTRAIALAIAVAAARKDGRTL